MDKRIIAINLPQFHPFKENDEWWGKGFTEWTNVTKAKPRFPGHYQPHLPSDTGFYDLRLPEARQMQADMAKEAGIYGFCYYHYWFNGKRLMNRPIDEILKSGEPDFPFMLCWANENWSRNWDGGFNKVLIEQKYSKEDDIDHMRWLCKNVFSDKRYITVDNKPVFMIYKPFLFPNIKQTLRLWRDIAKKEFSLDLYIIGVEHNHEQGKNYESLGFDASMDFQPVSLNKYKANAYFITYKIIRFILNFFNLNAPLIIPYKNYINYKLSEKNMGYKMYPCVSPGWDNASRRVNCSFTCFIGSTPQKFKYWLSNTFNKFTPFSKEENFLFINAWNEWAEGNHLEPDRKWGNLYLDSVKEVVEEKDK